MNIAEVQSDPVAVPKELFDQQLKAAKKTKFQYDLGTYWGAGVVGYWVFVMLVAAIVNLIHTYKPDFFDRIFGTSVTLWWRKTFSLPPVIGSKHHEPYKALRYVRIYAPTRGQAFVLLVLLIINILALVLHIDTSKDGPMIYPNGEDKMLAWMSHRTGVLAFVYIPILTLFACRNNPLIELTGFSYETFQVYHRWNARLMVFHAVVHGVLLTWFSLREHVLFFKWRHVHNWRAGNLAAYFSIIMLVFALRIVRRRLYEWFYFSHQILFLGFMVGVILHCDDYGWLGWIWAAIVIYGVEYLMRFLKLLYSGGIQKAAFRLVTPNTFRVKVDGCRRWAYRPGVYVYLRIFKRDMFWQSHPFSVYQSINSNRDYNLELVIQAKKGATRNMAKYLAKQPGHRAVLNVTVDGPYGHTHSILNYDSVLLLAGGSGFTAMYSFVSAIVPRLKSGQSVSLIWVVKSKEVISAFAEEVTELMGHKYLMDIQIYVTHSDDDVALRACTITISDELQSRMSSRISAATRDMVKSTEKLIKDTVEPRTTSVHTDIDQGYAITDYRLERSQSSYNNNFEEVIHLCRPDLSTEVNKFIKMTNGSRGICSCGPGSFVDSIREGVVQCISNASTRVDYFEESFSW